MTPDAATSSLSIEQLLAHASWVEGFARTLIRDAPDDLAQEAWLAAMRRPPADAAAPRAWLATVMRNLARMRFRGEARRRLRETDAATADVDASTPADSLHRFDLQQRLARLVLALDEPGRTSVVLAFHDGLSAAEIARRMGVPATTVRSRLRSALDTLRERLDAESGGDRHAWKLALAPLVRRPDAGAAAGRGATGSRIPLIAAIVVALAAATAAVVVALIATRSAAPPDPRSRAVAGDRAPAAASSAPPATGSAAGAGAVPGAAGRSAPALALAPGASEAAASDEDVAPSSPTVTPAFLRARRTAIDRIDECGELAGADGHPVRGHISLAVELVTEPAIVATVDIDRDRTTIRDPSVLDCLASNPTAIEAAVEQLRASGETVNGPISIRVEREVPPAPEPADDWPDDDASPRCAAGTALTGARPPQGHEQWCARPDGVRHGPAYLWDDDDHLTVIVDYVAGKPADHIRMHLPD